MNLTERNRAIQARELRERWEAFLHQAKSLEEEGFNISIRNETETRDSSLMYPVHPICKPPRVLNLHISITDEF